MITEHEIARYRAVQSLAREVIDELASTICAEDTETSIAGRATEALSLRGLTETWYHQCPALVLLGSRSCLSISGRHYVPALEPVGPVNLVTVDLSPKQHDVWGDCARSFFIEDGRCTPTPTIPEFREGHDFLQSLHAAMQAFVEPETTFHELFEWAAARIATAGFENLDFAGNVGHSIATHPQDRKYIKAANPAALGSVAFFTFEPHVRRAGGQWGFKHENIFFFDPAGRVETL